MLCSFLGCKPWELEYYPAEFIAKSLIYLEQQRLSEEAARNYSNAQNGIRTRGT